MFPPVAAVHRLRGSNGTPLGAELTD